MISSLLSSRRYSSHFLLFAVVILVRCLESKGSFPCIVIHELKWSTEDPKENGVETFLRCCSFARWMIYFSVTYNRVYLMEKTKSILFFSGLSSFLLTLTRFRCCASVQISNSEKTKNKLTSMAFISSYKNRSFHFCCCRCCCADLFSVSMLNVFICVCNYIVTHLTEKSYRTDNKDHSEHPVLSDAHRSRTAGQRQTSRDLF